jgi:hypothetical protein
MFAAMFAAFTKTDSPLPYFPGAPFLLGTALMTVAIGYSLTIDSRSTVAPSRLPPNTLQRLLHMMLTANCVSPDVLICWSICYDVWCGSQLWLSLCSDARGSGLAAQPQTDFGNDLEAPLMRQQHTQEHLADLPLPNQARIVSHGPSRCLLQCAPPARCLHGYSFLHSVPSHICQTSCCWRPAGVHSAGGSGSIAAG